MNGHCAIGQQQIAQRRGVDNETQVIARSMAGMRFVSKGRRAQLHEQQRAHDEQITESVEQEAGCWAGLRHDPTRNRRPNRPAGIE